MLKLTRKLGESFQIGDKHNQVKIGIDAPGDVEVWRDRIYAKIRERDRK